MSRAFRRSKATGWIFVAAAGFFAFVSAAIVVSVGRLGLDQLLHPVILLFAAMPLAFALLLGMAGRTYLRHQPVIVEVDQNGVSFAGAPPIAWGAVDAVIATETHIGYGPRSSLTLRRRFTPSDIAAKRAERTMHNLFTDRTVAPTAVGSTVEDMLAEFDAAMTEAGFARAEPPKKRFRLLQSTRRWEIRPADADADVTADP